MATIVLILRIFFVKTADLDMAHFKITRVKGSTTRSKIVLLVENARGVNLSGISIYNIHV